MLPQEHLSSCDKSKRRKLTNQLIETQNDDMHKFVFKIATAKNWEMIDVLSVKEQQADVNTT